MEDCKIKVTIMRARPWTSVGLYGTFEFRISARLAIFCLIRFSVSGKRESVSK